VRATPAPPAAAPAAQLSVAAAPPVAAVAAHGAMAPPNGAPLVESAVTGGRPDSTTPSHCSLKDIARHAARAAERELILRMLQHTRWNRKEAAEILGISYKALLYKIKENGLDKAS
jgi:DNA-binding NtrC family response regulator